MFTCLGIFKYLLHFQTHCTASMIGLHDTNVSWIPGERYLKWGPRGGSSKKLVRGWIRQRTAHARDCAGNATYESMKKLYWCCTHWFHTLMIWAYLYMFITDIRVISLWHSHDILIGKKARFSGEADVHVPDMGTKPQLSKCWSKHDFVEVKSSCSGIPRWWTEPCQEFLWFFAIFVHITCHLRTSSCHPASRNDHPKSDCTFELV